MRSIAPYNNNYQPLCINCILILNGWKWWKSQEIPTNDGEIPLKSTNQQGQAAATSAASLAVASPVPGLEWLEVSKTMVEWFLYGFHVVSMWFPCGFHVVSMWFPCGFHVVSMWFPSGFHLVSIWFPCGFHVVSMWFPCGFHVVSMWFPCGFHVVSMCFHVVSMWFPCGFHVVSMWFPCGFHVVSMWFPCGFHVVSMWFPCGFYVVSIFFRKLFSISHGFPWSWVMMLGIPKSALTRWLVTQEIASHSTKRMVETTKSWEKLPVTRCRIYHPQWGFQIVMDPQINSSQQAQNIHGVYGIFQEMAGKKNNNNIHFLAFSSS